MYVVVDDQAFRLRMRVEPVARVHVDLKPKSRVSRHEADYHPITIESVKRSTSIADRPEPQALFGLPWSGDPQIVYRLVLTVVLACYVAGIIATGLVPLSPALDVPFGIGGWLLFAALVVWSLLQRWQLRSDAIIASLLRPAPLAGIFAILVLIASYFALAWQLPPACHGISLNCFKGYEWSSQNGRFYHVTSAGVAAQISRATYVAEVGVHLRSAAAFGVYSLCFAWAAATTLGTSARRLRGDGTRIS